ncbi:hypothetical protein [Lysinibacillus sphaericus]|uniref:hypothetical protein n=1 Tax=Lysinibacillus sphaericus TaxID=1421 RepID=UPI0007890C65|nr:hypothetical protein [Lysinibacillus sphaericus]AMR93195.1 hypothetical protein A1T07_23600 [Lysinibacillus sphaericus]
MKQLKKKEGKIENRFARLNRIAKIEEFIRIKFHLGAVTSLSFINVFILVPIALCMWLGAILGQSEYDVDARLVMGNYNFLLDSTAPDVVLLHDHNTLSKGP